MPAPIRLLLSIALAVSAVAQSLFAQEPPPKTAKPNPETASGTASDTQALFDGKSLNHWRIVEQFDFARHGKVAVVDGAMQLAPGQPGTAVSWKGPFPRDRYEVSLEAMRYEGDDFFCGMTFPVGKEYCTLIIGGWGGTLIGLSNIDGQAADENETTLSERFDKERWYRVKLRVMPKAITVWLDGERIIEVERKDREFSIWWEQEPVRPFGIATWRTGARLRNIRLKRLAGD